MVLLDLENCRTTPITDRIGRMGVKRLGLIKSLITDKSNAPQQVTQKNRVLSSSEMKIISLGWHTVQ